MNYFSLDMTAPIQVSSRGLIWAVFGSLCLHAFMIFGVKFVAPDPVRLMNTVTLDVVLMNHRTLEPSKKPDVLAQVNLDGGGNTDERRQRASTPLPSETVAQPDDSLEIKATQQRQLEQEAQVLFREIQATHSNAPVLLQNDPQETLNSVLSSNVALDREELLAKAREIARLEGEIAQQYHAYQTRPRRAFFGGRAKEARFAHYVEDWRLKIERIGNLNYPQAARDQGIHGKLILSVEIHADGTLGKLKIDQSSGHSVLDEAAKNIVKMGAPYARFSDELAKDYDILTIVRTWSFTRNQAVMTQGQ